MNMPSSEQHIILSDEEKLLRDHFATLAMAELIAWDPDGDDPADYADPTTIARIAYEYADAMLAERNKSK